MATREITKYEDIMDSRDVIARIKELEEYRDAAIEALETADADSRWIAADGTEYGDTPDWTEEEHDELVQLAKLAEQGESSPDWSYGETLIRDSYFETYAQELAEDCGMLEHCDKWPATCIDWERAARELKMDYISIGFDDVTYWVRS